MYAQDPIFQDEDDKRWYFWDETWAFKYGPFCCRKAAEDQLQEYVEKYLR